MRSLIPLTNRRWLVVMTTALAATAGLVATIPTALEETPTAAFSPAARLAARERMIEKMKEEEIEPFDRPDEALEFFWAKRSPDGTPVPISELEEAAVEAERLPLFSSARGTVLTGARSRARHWPTPRAHSARRGRPSARATSAVGPARC